MSTEPGTVVVFGASGYVGGRLIPSLLEAGHRVRAVTRNPATLDVYPWRADVEVVSADLLAEDDSVAEAVTGADVAFYLVHSMGSGDDFADKDRAAAEKFVAASAGSDLRRVVYLGGLGSGDLSPHLESRQEVGRILRTGSVPTTELRAAVIIGSGSLSFEMTRYLTEVLPVMVAPKWILTECQPIAIRDVLDYLVATIDEDHSENRIYEIGGSDVLTYRDMMLVYAEEAGLNRRRIFTLPVLTLGLSARWISLVTPLPRGVATELVDSLRNRVVVTDQSVRRLLVLEPTGYRAAIRRALDVTRRAQVPTRWTPSEWRPADPLPSDPDYAMGTVFSDKRSRTTEAAPEDVAWAFNRVGGTVGYYSASWAWEIRGLIDQLFGGAGIRRGRRHPETIGVGEPLDFWRVVGLQPGVSLQLKAEMRVPGEAWLEWRVDVDDEGTTLLEQTAWFAPRGLFGRLYWWVLYPFHGLIFPQMIAGVVSAAESRATEREHERR